MSGEMIKVRLTGPAKVGARWLKPGDEEVTAEEKADLVAAGLIEPDEAAADVTGTQTMRSYTKAEWEAAVGAAARELGKAFDAEIESLDAEVKAIMAQAEADVAAANARATSAEVERDGLTARIVELEGKLLIAQNARTPASAGDAGAADGNSSTSPPGGAVAPATTNTPPEKALKTAPKKGAAATPKG